MKARLAAITATLVLVATLVATSTAASADPTAPDALVRVLAAAPQTDRQPATVTIAGRATDLGLGQATPWTPVPAGTTVTIHSPTGDDHTMAASAGCSHLLVVYATDTASTAVADHADCAHQRLPPGKTGVRYVHGTTDGRPARLAVDDEPVTTTVPIGASTTGIADPGRHRLAVRGADGEKYTAGPTVELSAGSAYTVAWVGGAETPPRVIVLEDGSQADDPPLDPSLPINTDAPAATDTVLLVVLGIVSALAAVAHARPSRRRASRRGGMAAQLIVVAMTASCSMAASEPSAPGGGTVGSDPTATSPRSGPDPVASPPPTANRLTVRRVDIDTIDVHADVVEVADRDVPALPTRLARDEVAYVTSTTPPGQPGTTMIAGHVTADGAPAVFHDLATLTRGDTIAVTTSNGTVNYTVRYTLTVPKGHLPAGLFGPNPMPTLVAVTCTGPVDPSTGLRTDNLVVVATLDSPAG